MAFQRIGSGFGMLYPPWINTMAGTPTYSGLTIDATGDKVAFIGKVWNADAATKNINKVHIRLGTVTPGGTPATFRVSLQNVTSAVGVTNPDGSVDQSATATTDTLTANTVNSFTLDASRTVTYGEYLAVVFDYSAFTAGDVVVINGLAGGTATLTQQMAISFLNTGAWAVQNTTFPLVVLEFDDGTFGTLDNHLLVPTSISTPTQAVSTSNKPEYGMTFTTTVPLVIDAFWFHHTYTASASGTFILYSDTTTTVVATSIEPMQPQVIARLGIYSTPLTTINPSTVYHLVYRSQNSVATTYFTLNYAAAGHAAMNAFSSTSGLITRVSAAGAFTTTSTMLPMCGVRIVQVVDGVSSAAGGSSSFYIGA